MNDDFGDKEYREAFVEANIRNGIAFQIRALRKKNEWSQGQLGEICGKAQNVISRLEDPDYGKFTIQTLLALARTFDVALMVKFVSYGDLFNTLKNLSPEALAVPSFEKEMQERQAQVAKSLEDLTRPRFANKYPAANVSPFEKHIPFGALASMAAAGQDRGRVQ